MVSVTIGHGTSLMAPSNIRKTMTSALRTRPVQRASLEVGRVSAMTVMIDPRGLEWLLGFKTNEGSGSRQGARKIFDGATTSFLPRGRRWHRRSLAVVPLWRTPHQCHDRGMFNHPPHCHPALHCR